MKIAFIGQNKSLAKRRGIEKKIPEIAVQLAKHGHSVFALVQKERGAKKISNHRGVTVVSIPSFGKKSLDDFVYILLASAYALFHRSDIVHFFQAKRKTSEMAIKTLKYFGKNVITSNPLVGTGIRFAKKTNRILHWELKDKKYILTVGKLNKESGTHLLIEAFKHLEDTSRTPNNFKLVFAGEDLKNDEYGKYLQTISRGRSNIVFAGRKTGETLEQLFSHAYLFVDPSESNESQKFLLEAMGHGLAPLVSATEENLEIVGEDGFSFVSKSLADLQAKLAFLLSRPDEIKRSSILVKKKIRKDFGWESAVEKTIKEYNSIL